MSQQRQKPPRRLTREQYPIPPSSVRVYFQMLDRRGDLHWQEFYEVTFIISGEGTHIFNGNPYPLTRGSLFLVTPSDFHMLCPTPGSTMEVFNVIFSHEMIAQDTHGLLFSQLGRYMTVLADRECDAMEAEFRRLSAETSNRGLGHLLVVHGTLQRILVDLTRKCVGDGDTSDHQAITSQSGRLHNALVYIHHHFREPITLADVAAQATLSPNYFSECFHTTSGTSFQTYLKGLRLRFAMSLLCASDLSVTDVCYASGFSTLSHFERAFKREFGQPPSAYAARSRVREASAIRPEREGGDEPPHSRLT